MQASEQSRRCPFALHLELLMFTLAPLFDLLLPQARKAAGKGKKGPRNPLSEALQALLDDETCPECGHAAASSGSPGGSDPKAHCSCAASKTCVVWLVHCCCRRCCCWPRWRAARLHISIVLPPPTPRFLQVCGRGPVQARLQGLQGQPAPQGPLRQRSGSGLQGRGAVRLLQLPPARCARIGSLATRCTALHSWRSSR